MLTVSLVTKPSLYPIIGLILLRQSNQLSLLQNIRLAGEVHVIPKLFTCSAVRVTASDGSISGDW